MEEESTPLSTAGCRRTSRPRPGPRGTHDLGHDLGTGLAALAAVLDPAAIVLGGYFVPLGAYVVPAADGRCSPRLPSAQIHLPQIRLSSLGIHAAAARCR